jgi:alcohol dehydrogenase class IV
MPQQEYIGYGSIDNLKEVLSKQNLKNIFLVTGKSSYENSGAKKVIEPYLNGYNVVHFYDFEVNPKLSDIERGIMLFRKNNCDFVIAVGGGSVMDAAKLINLLAANNGKAKDYIKKKQSIENKGRVLVAIPTTSGTGSEATKFAVATMDKMKHALEHEFIIPDYAIIDPQFTMYLPQSITASTGMDALSQAIESYWCVNSTDESKGYAREAIRLIMKNLEQTTNNLSRESREAMARGAYLSGKAINITRTTVCHAVSYPITSYFNVPHGHAVALSLAQMLVYNSKVTENDLLDKRGVDYVKKTIMEIVNLIGAVSSEEASEKITNLMKEIGLSTKLSELGVKTDDDIELIIKNGFNPERVKNNPRRLTEEDLRKILGEIR